MRIQHIEENLNNAAFGDRFKGKTLGGAFILLLEYKTATGGLWSASRTASSWSRASTASAPSMSGEAREAEDSVRRPLRAFRRRQQGDERGQHPPSPHRPRSMNSIPMLVTNLFTSPSVG